MKDNLDIQLCHNQSGCDYMRESCRPQINYLLNSCAKCSAATTTTDATECPSQKSTYHAYVWRQSPALNLPPISG